jgi:hypothetical protein
MTMGLGRGWEPRERWLTWLKAIMARTQAATSENESFILVVERRVGVVCARREACLQGMGGQGAGLGRGPTPMMGSHAGRACDDDDPIRGPSRSLIGASAP